MTSYHLCIPVEKGIELIMAGKSPFNGSPQRALKVLTDKRNAKIEFHTGCDNETEEGRCGGHKTKTS